MKTNITNNPNTDVVIPLRDTIITMNGQNATIDGAPMDEYEMIEVGHKLKELNPLSLRITESVDAHSIIKILKTLDLGNNNTLQSLTLERLYPTFISSFAQLLEGNATLTSLNINPLQDFRAQDFRSQDYTIVKLFPSGTEKTFAETINNILLNNKALNSFVITLTKDLYQNNQAHFGDLSFNNVTLVEGNIEGNCVEVELIAQQPLLD
jgi:hypothetical protein